MGSVLSFYLRIFVGGDLWVLYYENATKKVHCLDGSGKTPAAFTPEKVTGKRGHVHDAMQGGLCYWTTSQSFNFPVIPGRCT